MANNRELSQFGSYVTVNPTDNTVGVGTSVILTGGVFVGGVQAIRPDGTWGGSAAGIQGAQGITGLQGLNGLQGINGIQGATGSQGTLGTQGISGAITFASGTLMLFQQTAAPTGWTKQTTHNDKALRVVSGSASSGGSTAFTSVFASRTPSGSVSGSNSGGSVDNTTVTGTVGGTTLSSSQIPSHTHDMRQYGTNTGCGPAGTAGQGACNTQANFVTNSTGGGGSHDHGLTMNAHNHTFTNPTWSGTFSGSSMDFAVQYVDLIIASKD